VLPRSGLAAQHGVTVLNAPGVVDSGYRGEIVVVLINHDPEQAYEVRRGDRIAQLMITTAISVEVTDVEKLPMSRRGSAGLGESGR
jgi:dUTP pyrophosphatase